MSYFAVFAIVSLLILVHELGHFAVARLVGIPVARFSLGMGGALWSVTRGGTEYRISVIPLGGYVLPQVQDGGHRFLSTPTRARVARSNLGWKCANSSPCSTALRRRYSRSTCSETRALISGA